MLPNAMVPNTNVAPVARKNNAFKHLMSVHWIMAVCYLILFIGGTTMARLPDEFPFRGNFYGFHKGVGVLTIGILSWRIIILLRVWWRKYTKHSPRFSLAWLRKVLLHISLYLFMWVVPFTGVFLSNSYRSGNVSFLWMTLPDMFPKNAEVLGLARNLHFWLAYTFLAFTILHTIDQRKVVWANWRRFLNWLKPKSIAGKA